MNNHKFCFIICTNHSGYLVECKKFIEALLIPEGFEIEILSITKALSMTSGYNAGMKESDAKYNIYLHQDVFIIKKDFLSQLLEIFTNEQIGMVGMVGAVELPSCCIPWYGKRCGKLYGTDYYKPIQSEFDVPVHKLKKVEAIDGLLMATQYNLLWREDLFDGWDYYDVSQSQEFFRAGYQVVVPEMEEPWCIHDDGILNLKDYYKYRRIFMKEYRS